MVDTRSNYTLFDGRRAHRVEQFQGGDRYSLVFFSVAGWARGPRHALPEGVVYPTDQSLRYFSNLIAPARGNAGSILAAFRQATKGPNIVLASHQPPTPVAQLPPGDRGISQLHQSPARCESPRSRLRFPSQVATRHIEKTKRPRNDAQALSVPIDMPQNGDPCGPTRDNLRRGARSLSCRIQDLETA